MLFSKPLRICLGSRISLLCLTSSLAVFAQAVNSEFVADRPAHSDLSARLEAMAARTQQAAARRVVPIGRTAPGFTYAGPDTAVQSKALPDQTFAAATGGLNFEGLGSGFPGYRVSSAPPDTNLAVGPTQVVQWVNSEFAIFDKATGAVVQGVTPGNALWQGFGGVCESTNQGDPVVLYDKLAGRWFFSQFAFNTDLSGNLVAPFLQCYAVSQSSDARGPYFRFSYNFNTAFNDYGKHGIWPSAYFSTFNFFLNSGNGAAIPGVCAIDRAAALAGTAPARICTTLRGGVFTTLPADFDGTIPPPAGSPGYLLQATTANTLRFMAFNPNFATPANSTFRVTTIPVAAFTGACLLSACVPQPGTTQKLDGLGDRLMVRLAYRRFADREALVVNQTVRGPNQVATPRWYEIRLNNGAPVLFQQGTYAPDSASRFMGSIAMDKMGNIAIGYSVSSTSVFPGIRVTGRAPGDPLGQLQTEQTIINGTGSQVGGLDRWGDYSAMSIDPSDDCTFWYTTEYIKTTGSFNWNTRIATLKFANCQ